MNTPKPVWLENPERAKEIAICLIDEFGKDMIDDAVSINDGTARACRALASPPAVVASSAYDKLRRTFGY